MQKMDGFMPLKMKRKNLGDVNDEFSDFSLVSPARKIRRLDIELPRIMEEQDSEIPIAYKQSLPTNNVGGAWIEEMPPVSENEERAIVLFRPANTPLLQSPSNFLFSVNPDLMSGFKNQLMWPSQSNPFKSEENVESDQEKDRNLKKECLAVVPWVPSQLPQMDDDDGVPEEMDIEEEEDKARNNSNNGSSAAIDSLNQWKQQHCFIPQPPPNTASPLVWFR